MNAPITIAQLRTILAAAKALQDLDPTTSAIVAQYITTTPKKPTITLKD